MKKIYVTTEGLTAVLFVDDENQAYVIDETSFEEPLTVEVARNTDYSNLDNCQTAQECRECMTFGDIIEYNPDDYFIEAYL